jgi:glycosyltransferase involved in cell wall biosynthesis
MSTSSYKVSVLVITYNHERFIAQALHSALAQSVDFPIEIVVGDDRSTDGTVKVIQEIAARASVPVRLIDRPQNVGFHRNLVDTLAACGGQYVAVLEGDDFWTDSSKLQRQVQFLDQHPDYSAAAHNVVKSWDSEPARSELYCAAGLPTKLTLDHLLRADPVPTCSVMFRRGLIANFPDWFFKLPMADWPLHALNARHGPMYFDPRPMGAYRVHAGGVWSRRTLVQMHESLLAAHSAFRDAFGADHRALLQRMVSYDYFQLSLAHESSGQHHQARACLWKSLLTSPLNPERRFRDTAKSIARLYFSPLYRMAKRLRLVERPVPRLQSS